MTVDPPLVVYLKGFSGFYQGKGILTHHIYICFSNKMLAGACLFICDTLDVLKIICKDVLRAVCRVQGGLVFLKSIQDVLHVFTLS